MADDFPSLQVDDLLNQLRTTPPDFIVKSDSSNNSILESLSTEPVKEEDLGDYIIKKTTTLVDQTMSAFKDIKNIAVSSNDPDTISALADLVKAANSAIDSLNKINMQNKKLKSAKEVAAIYAAAKAKEDKPPSSTNIITIGSREEVLKILDQAKQKSSAIDAEYTEQTLST
ncbi:MAG: hypothetical protein LC127_12265 [Chitinophagales bacterium]|nr:hypothetical protein [Chitinophagales bacterium]